MNRTEKALEKLHKGTFIPATLLALDENRHFDEKTQRMLMRYYLDCGVGGIATAVHSTQFAIRDPKINLFEPVIRVVAEEIDEYERRTGKVIVKVGGVCGDVKQAAEEAELLKSCGYDAVLLSPGGLGSLSEDELIERTKRIAEIIPVIGFYLQPAVGGRKFSYSYWEKFCAVDNVVAVKAAPFNRYLTLDVVRAAAFSERSDQIALYTGNDDNLVIDLAAVYSFEKDGRTVEKSFVGGLLGHWSVWTKKAVEIFEKIKAGAERDELLKLANEITDVNAAFFDTANNFKGCIAGLHYVLMRQGIFKGVFCLDKNETLSPGQLEEIERVYRMYPHLNDDEFIKQNIGKWR